MRHAQGFITGISKARLSAVTIHITPHVTTEGEEERRPGVLHKVAALITIFLLLLGLLYGIYTFVAFKGTVYGAADAEIEGAHVYAWLDEEERLTKLRVDVRILNPNEEPFDSVSATLVVRTANSTHHFSLGYVEGWPPKHEEEFRLELGAFKGYRLKDFVEFQVVVNATRGGSSHVSVEYVWPWEVEVVG